MSTLDRSSVPGIVKGGVVVPQTNVALPDGAHVEIMLQPQAISPELSEEIAAWDHASNEAWAMIDQWEADES